MTQIKHKIICGNVLDVLKEIPEESVDMVFTSPPYWGLRDYGQDTTTEWKDGWHGQLGLEPTPELYIEHLRMVFAKVKRVLKKTGTCWVNISDTYAGYWGNKNGDGTEYGNLPVHGYNQNKREKLGELMKSAPWMKPKSMCMIPERFAFMMIDLGYILRNKIIWHKPNPMPSSVKDRFNTTYELVYFFSKSQKYWFDLDAVRDPYTEPLNRWGGDKLKANGKSHWDEGTGQEIYRDRDMRPNKSGKNPGDVWTINTQPFPEAHFAVFPETLCEKPILAGCPAEVCKHCGMARVRIIETDYEVTGSQKGVKQQQGAKEFGVLRPYEERKLAIHKTIGWTDCLCLDEDKYEPGIVLDPFGGSGTVAVVAEKLGRSSILIDIKKDYCKMAYRRLIPFIRQGKIDREPSTIEKIGFKK